MRRPPTCRGHSSLQEASKVLHVALFCRVSGWQLAQQINQNRLQCLVTPPLRLPKHCVRGEQTPNRISETLSFGSQDASSMKTTNQTHQSICTSDGVRSTRVTYDGCAVSVVRLKLCLSWHPPICHVSLPVYIQHSRPPGNTPVFISRVASGNSRVNASHGTSITLHNLYATTAANL
jgi:hypothetical protein